MPREKRATSKDRWWRPSLGGQSRAELPGAGERGDKGSLRGMRGGERFYSQGRRRSQVFPHKEESAGYSGGWCPRALCRYLLGPGCRGSVPGSLASLRNLSVVFFQGIPQRARHFNNKSPSLEKKQRSFQTSGNIIQSIPPQNIVQPTCWSVPLPVFLRMRLGKMSQPLCFHMCASKGPTALDMPESIIDLCGISTKYQWSLWDFNQISRKQHRLGAQTMNDVKRGGNSPPFQSLW